MQRLQAASSMLPPRHAAAAGGTESASVSADHESLISTLQLGPLAVQIGGVVRTGRRAAVE